MGNLRSVLRGGRSSQPAQSHPQLTARDRDYTEETLGAPQCGSWGCTSSECLHKTTSLLVYSLGLVVGTDSSKDHDNIAGVGGTVKGGTGGKEGRKGVEFTPTRFLNVTSLPSRSD